LIILPPAPDRQTKHEKKPHLLFFATSIAFWVHPLDRFEWTGECAIMTGKIPDANMRRRRATDELL